MPGYSVKYRCRNCECFILTEGEEIEGEYAAIDYPMPLPPDGCQKPPCPCHSGIGLLPDREVIVLDHSAQEEASHYSHIDTMN